MQQACVTEDMAEEVLRGTVDVKAAIYRCPDGWMLKS